MMRSLRTWIWRCGLAAIVVGLWGCDAQQGDLREFVESVRSQPAGDIPPIPEVKVYQPFNYPEHTRDPFDGSSINSQRSVRVLSTSSVRIDSNRPRQFMENFPLDSLKMVGTLQQQGQLWGLIRTPDGTVQRVGTGQYLGQNHGRVTKIMEGTIEMIEIVSDGLGGYMERPASIALSSN
ncbi:MAG: pilus assembly protein PilP [Thiotrichales bacterium]